MKNSALFVLCALLTACGGSDDNKTTNQTTIQSYTITTNVEGEGQLQPTSLVLKQGESGTLELQPAQGYQVASVEGCNGTYSNNTYTIENATQSCQVTAKFEAKTINVTLESDAYITLITDKDSYAYGDSAVISYELSSGYLLNEITGCNGALNDELYKVDALTADCQITATTLPTSQVFSGEDEAQVNVTVLDGKGSILSSSKGVIESSNPELPALNSSLEFERDLLAVDIATESGQTIELQITYENPLPAQFTYQKLIEQQWQAVGQENVVVSEDRSTLTLTLTDGGAGDSDGVINGVIKDPGGPAVVKMHTVTVNPSTGGAITPESLAVAHGDTALFTISTDAGYTLESVTGCNGTLNGTSYQTAAITQSCEISAEFSLASFLITAQAGEGGQISPSEQMASYGNTVTFTVTADDDQNIESVQGCDGSLAGNIYTTGIITAACEVRATFDPQTVLVTAQASMGGSISPMSQELNIGQQASLIVTPNEGYSIANVTGCNGSLSGNTYTTSAVTANCQVQASFSINSYTVSASAGEGGTVNPTTQSVNHGSSAQITITPNEGYSIDAVTGCNGSLSGNNYTTSAVTANCQVQASFSIDSYTVSASAGEGGTVNPATQSVNHGSSAQITITPNEGYSIDAVTGCNGSLSGNTYTTGAVTANCQVQASFSINNYTVSASAGEGGTVNPATQSVDHGSSAQITITPNEGYSIDAVTGCSGSLSGNTYTTGAVTANCQVQASFSINSYTVSASAGEGGTVNPTTQSVNHGSSAQITITPNEGYSIDTVTGCNGSLNGNTYTTSAVTANCQVQASFSIDSYTVSASAGEGGTVNPATQSVNHGSSAQITITPNEGYSIDAVTGCNGSLNGSTYTTSAVTANCQVQASFSINSYTVSASAGEGGTVNPATQSVNHGSSAQITITPNEGYSIDAVTGCNGSLSGNTYTTSAVTANCQVQASFSINSYTVSASAGEGGTVNPTTQSVNHGSSAQITITPNEGYSIDAVTGCSGSLSGNIYTTGAVTANCQVQASFSINSYTVSSSAGEGGAVSPTTQSVNYGSSAQVTVTANEGYMIDRVYGCEGGLVESVFTTGLIISQCTVTAEFKIIPKAPTISAQATVQSITVSWDSLDNIAGYTLYYATSETITPDNYTDLDGVKVEFDTSTTAHKLTNLQSNTTYYIIMTSHITGTESDVSNKLAITTAAIPFNDTGITWCADGSNNNLDCPVTGYEGQDAEYGRDAQAKAGTLEKVGGGNGGFDFTKLDANGNDLSESASTWSCVRDNHTGLIWEVKTDDGGLHDKNDRYNWYNPDSNTNGGRPGYQDDDGDICYGYDANNEASYCNTYAYVERVNTQSLCGANDWRMPTRLELMGIVDNGTKNPAIDTQYFPQTHQSSGFWSSSPGAFGSSGAWFLSSFNGHVYSNSMYYDFRVRLVRARP